MKNLTITLSALKSLPKSKPSSTKIIIWDRGLPGFGAYKTSSGRISFIYQYRMKGSTTKSVKLGELAEVGIDGARNLAGDLAHKRRRGVDPIAERKMLEEEERAKTVLLLSEYSAAYLARRIAAGRPLNKAQTAIVTRDVVGHLGHHRMDKLTIEDVEKFAEEIGERGISARRMGLVYLNLILNDAVTREKIARNPAKSVEIPKAGERSRRLREDELMRFMEAARDMQDPRGDIHELLVRLLKRKDEVGSLVWEELDLAKGEWVLPDTRTKNKESQRIILPRQALEIIKRQQPDPALRNGPVFTLDSGKTSPVLGAQIKELLDANLHRRLELANLRDGTSLSVTHFTVHDIRTTGASRLQEKPFQIRTEVIDTILLHTIGGKITRTYQQATLEIEAGEALQIWNDHLDELMRAPSAWPGGRDLPSMKPAERDRRFAELRVGWPMRADQKRAKERIAKEGKKKRDRRTKAGRAEAAAKNTKD